MSGNERILTWEGISLPSYGNGRYLSNESDAAFDQIRATGATSVSIVPSFVMSNKSASTMTLDALRSESLSNIRSAILDVTSRGMNVMLKPHLEVVAPDENGNPVWRADISPENPEEWFKSYKAMMVEYAKVAQEAGVAMLCIGSELKSMSGPEYTEEWVEIIKAVRAVYYGFVTYAATDEEALHIEFWDKLDYIGVNPYFSMTDSNTPTVDDLVKAWIEPPVTDDAKRIYGNKSVVATWKELSEKWNKKVIFTEIGYGSYDGANRNPRWISDAEIDEREQQDCYDALFQVITNHGGRWLDGAFLWSYQTFANPKDHGIPGTDFTPQGKLANAIITRAYSSPAHEKGLTRSGSADSDTLDGGYHNDTLLSKGGSDELWGGAGHDRLDGGTGADIMQGGSGNDTYYVDSDGDAVIDSDGTDTIIATIQYRLTDVDRIENLMAAAEAMSLALSGNSLDNIISGTAGNDTLNGAAGSDQLKGAQGDDTYMVDRATDRVMDVSGHDTILTSVSYRLVDGSGVEVLKASPDTQGLTLTGNALDNIIIGTDGSDSLDGAGGQDKMSGGQGDDVYRVGTLGDVVEDTGGEDTIITSINYTLGSSIENLMADDGIGLSLTGNHLANKLTGNAQSNKLSGGLGQDTLTGGAGKDFFVFNAPIGNNKTNKLLNLDTITDFSVKDDTFWLDNAIFKKLGKKGTELKPAKLDKKFFIVGTKAKDKNDYLVYDKKKGVLYYDADGSGKGKAVEIAKLNKNLKMTAADFLVI